jgi:hypothetical protein
MKLSLTLAALLCSAVIAKADPLPYPDYLGPVQYPPGTSAQAIAQNEAVRASIVGKPGLEFCAVIDTQDVHGKCLVKLVLDAGGGDGGSGGGGF